MLEHMRGALIDLAKPRPSHGMSKVGAGGREEAAVGNNGPGHLSCLAALPFAYNGSGGPASSGFLFTPLLSGDTSVPYKGPFVPSSLFCQHLTL